MRSGGLEGYRQRDNGDFGARGGQSRLFDRAAARQPEPDTRGLKTNPMGNEYDYKCMHLVQRNA
jgi:hypothetical protein